MWGQGGERGQSREKGRFEWLDPFVRSGYSKYRSQKSGGGKFVGVRRGGGGGKRGKGREGKGNGGDKRDWVSPF